MKRFLSYIILLAAALSSGAQTPHWNNLAVCQENREAPHVRRFPYASLDALRRLDYRTSPDYRCLDGRWDFFFVEDPNLAPSEALRHEHSPYVQLQTIEVPGNMELQGYGTPVYVNVANEFKSNPPYAPERYNPVGLYMRDFEVEESWTDGSPVFLHIGAVKSCCYVYVNGRYVGYSEDSKTAAEFEISKHLLPGKNRVAVQVFRFCSGSYLECQDMWRMSGITRSVSLYRVPKTYVKDYAVAASLEESDWKTGVLSLRITTSLPIEKTMMLWARVLDKDGNIVAQARKAITDTSTVFSNDDFGLGEVQPWSDKNPYLYTLAISILGSKGQEMELVGGKIGFRNIGIRNIGGYNLLCLNGTPVEIRGVNRHEHSGTTGHYVSPSEMRKDIELMQRAHINAVRTSHYPCDELWYDLCDSAGIMLWDEANVESHAQGYGDASLAKNPDWIAPMIFRCNNMFQRDKNHPSVVAWSLGNECGNGVCTEATYRFMKAQDATRPVTYERAEFFMNTDVVEIMYPSVDYIGGYARKVETAVASEKAGNQEPNIYRPYIIAEYCHAMGNSLGSLKDYWDTIDRYPILQGGFIWDWVDQSIIRYDDRGRKWYAVGGDLGTIPDCGDDDAFCANGLVSSDRIPHQHYYHCQHVYGKAPRADMPEHIEAIVERYPASYIPSQIKKTRKGDVLLLEGPGTFAMRVNTSNGEIESFSLDGKERLAAPIRPNFWRPPTLNDLVDRNGAPAWKGLDHLQYDLLNCATRQDKENSSMKVDLLYRLSSPDGQAMMLREIVQVNCLGAIRLDYRLEPQGSFRTLPKMGVQLGIARSLDSLWLWGSRDEVYPDRYHGGKESLPRTVASTASYIGEMHVVPQESGNRLAKHLIFGSQSTEEVLDIESCDSKCFNFSIREYDDSTLSRCTRINQLPEPLPYYVLNIDYKQAGLGSATCGPGVREPYILSGDSIYIYSFHFRFGNTRCPSTWFGRPEEIDVALPSVKKESPIKSIISNLGPEQKYGKGFPQILYDSKIAVPSDYSNGWAGFNGQDSVVLEIALKNATDINSIVLGACNAPNDWVLLPKDVRLQWSKDGKNYSEWNLMELAPTSLSAGEKNAVASNPNLANDRQRKCYVFTTKKSLKKVRHIRLKIYPQPMLPETHSYAGEKAWLMIDEVEVR